MRFTFSNLPAVGWKLPMRDIVTVAPGATGFRVKLPVPLRSKTLPDYTGDVEALDEVMAAYRWASEPAAVGAGR